MFNIDFELSEAEDEEFTAINNHTIMKFFKIILFMIGLQNKKNKLDNENKDKGLNQKLDEFKQEYRANL